VREWHGMRQKASAEPVRSTAAVERDATTDFIVAVVVCVGASLFNVFRMRIGPKL
jgi:hypothetical protein